MSVFALCGIFHCSTGARDRLRSRPRSNGSYFGYVREKRCLPHSQHASQPSVRPQMLARPAHALIDPGATYSFLSGDFPRPSDPKPACLRGEIRVITLFADSYSVWFVHRMCDLSIWAIIPGKSDAIG